MLQDSVWDKGQWSRSHAEHMVFGKPVLWGCLGNPMYVDVTGSLQVYFHFTDLCGAVESLTQGGLHL